MNKKLVYLFLIIYCSFSMASESDLYDFSWLDKDKEVYVLQNRKFKKKNKFNLTAGYGQTASGAFVDANAIQFRAGYFFTEELGFEAIYSINSGTENLTAASVRSQGGSIPFRRIVESYTGAMLVWAPFYSKINTFNKIIYLDFIFGLGVGKIDEKNNRSQFDKFSPTEPDILESHTGVIWDFGTKIYFTEMLNGRFDITGLHYKARKPIQNSQEESWYQNIDMTFSVGIDL